MSLIGQWAQEFSNRLLPGTLRVVMYYGPDRDRLDLFSSERPWDVVITTYGVLISEWKKYVSLSSLSSVESLYRHRWERVLLDEAHCIRNQKTDAFKACAGLKSECRWVITGTPIQNKIDDLFSLVKFLQHEPWNQWRWWYKTILQPLTQKDLSGRDGCEEEQGLRVLKELLQTIMLRRTKNSIDSLTGLKILNLPPKFIEMKFVELNSNERIFYDTFAKRSQELSRNILRTCSSDGSKGQGTSSVIKGYAALFTLLMRLRQICNHPLLVLKSLTSPSTSSSTSGDLNLNTIHLRQSQGIIEGTSGVEELQQESEQSSEYLKTIIKKFERYLQPDLGRDLEESQPSEEESSLDFLGQQENVFDQECVVCLELLEVSLTVFRNSRFSLPPCSRAGSRNCVA
jgi:SNF2 family DNA or RNA helicase